MGARENGCGVTYREVVALVLVLAGVDFGEWDVEFKARVVHVDVVILCARCQYTTADSPGRAADGKYEPVKISFLAFFAPLL